MLARRGCSGNRTISRPRSVSRPSRTAPSRSSSVRDASSVSDAGRSYHSIARGSPPQATMSSSAARQVHPANLGFGARPQAIARIPQPADSAGRGSAGAARSLVRRILGNALGDQAVDRAGRIVPGDFVQPRIDNRRHARDRQRRLGDVGGDDDAPRAVGRALNRPILAGRVEPAVERQHLDPARVDERPHSSDRLMNFEHAGKETQHVARRVGQHRRRRHGDGFLRRVGDLDRMHPARDFHNRTAVEKARRPRPYRSLRT